jgi:amidase
MKKIRFVSRVELVPKNTPNDCPGRSETSISNTCSAPFFVNSTNPYGPGLDAWYDVFRTLQGVEAWAAHGPWIEQARPRLGPQCAKRFEIAARIDPAAAERAGPARDGIGRRLDALLEGGALMIVPSAAGVAPRADAPASEHEAVRDRLMGITCIAGLGGLPQVSLPLARLDAGPIGLSVIAARGEDAQLLDLVAHVLGEVSRA